MLIVGGYDDAVLALNEQAKARMPGEAVLKIVPRATHLFEEPGALAQVADLAGDWFWKTIKASPATRPRDVARRLAEMPDNDVCASRHFSASHSGRRPRRIS